MYVNKHAIKYCLGKHKAEKLRILPWQSNSSTYPWQKLSSDTELCACCLSQPFQLAKAGGCQRSRQLMYVIRLRGPCIPLDYLHVGIYMR